MRMASYSSTKQAPRMQMKASSPSELIWMTISISAENMRM